jgi:uncharacterized damage-inducible protein DinB
MQSFLEEMERESITTRKMLERIPPESYDWRPHEKSMTLRQLATHVAEIPGWLKMVLNTSDIDFEKNEYRPTIINNSAELLKFFEDSLATGKAELSKADDSQLTQTWTMRNGEEIWDCSPKSEVIRGVFCQVVHHRAQLGVYLRILNVPIPGSYGPSADD